jgi:hypothetical protein
MAAKYPWFPKWERWYDGLYEFEGHKRDTKVRPKGVPKKIPKAVWLLRLAKMPGIKNELKRRRKVMAWWNWSIKHSNEIQIHYQMLRPMEWLRQIAKLWILPRWADCSEWFTDGFAVSKLQDPNGEKYNGIGNTSYLLAHGKKIAQSQLREGDAIIFHNPDHVCVVMSCDPDPWLGSHGTESGPKMVRLSVEKGYHPGHYDCVRFIEAKI